MMNLVKFANNTLTINSGIEAAKFDKMLSKAELKDEKGNLLFALGVSDRDSAEGTLTEKMLICNARINGNLAFVQVLPASKTIEDIKKMYGKALLNAKKYLPGIKDMIEKETLAVDELFATEEEA